VGKRRINVIHIMGQADGKGFALREFSLHPMFYKVSGDFRFKSPFEVVLSVESTAVLIQIFGRILFFSGEKIPYFLVLL
jgi:hypothetical protein